MTTLAALASIRLIRTRRCPGDGVCGTVCNVATTGLFRAATKSSTNSPSLPPQIPYSCWTDTTRASDSFSALATRW